MRASDVSCFALVASGLVELPGLLRTVFKDPWVASYQIGFGPPLVRSSTRLVRELKDARSAVDKLDTYFRFCILDDQERARLATLFQRMVVRRAGPVEAEALDELSAEVLDLAVRLYVPKDAPPRVAASMLDAGIDADAIPRDTPPDDVSGRFHVRLTDPRNERLLYTDAVKQLLNNVDDAAALELRVPVAVRELYWAWLARFCGDSGVVCVDIGAPAPHARVSWNGTRS